MSEVQRPKSSVCRLGRLLLLPLLALMVLAPSAQATFSGQNGKIAFVGYDGHDFEIYSMNPNGSDLMRLTDDSFEDSVPDWSPDGTKIAYAANVGGDYEIFVMNADGSGKVQLTNNQVNDCADPPACSSFYPADDGSPSWSPDGRIAFETNRDHAVNREDSQGSAREVYVMNADGSDQRMISNGSQCTDDSSPEWSPNGQRIAYDSIVPFLCSPSGARVTELVSPEPGGPRETACAYLGIPFEWTTGSQTLLHTRFESGAANGDLYEQTAPCGSETRLTNTSTVTEWFASPSPDNTRIVFAEYTNDDYQTSDLVIMNRDGSGRIELTDNSVFEGQPDWQSSDLPAPTGSLMNGYARPRGASPTTVRLVPAFRPCAGANAAHGPPLTQPSCSPPQASSPYLTVGTPDSNGYASQSVGYVQMRVVCNPPAPGPVAPCSDPGEQADVKLDARLTDVRCLGSSGGCTPTGDELSDYFGELQVKMALRITDRLNGRVGEGNVPATSMDVPFSFSMPCTGDSDLSVGSTCAVSTSANAVTGGLVRESRRTIWQVGQVEIWDGGEGGAPNTGGNTLFAVQGLFAP